MRKVPSSGPINADIVLVGEAPGGEEELAGVPFVGPSGYELRGMLRSAGIEMASCRIMNVCRYRPRGNDISTWLHFGAKPPKDFQEWVHLNGAWVTPQIREGIQELKEELEAIHPKVIVALGNTPLWALTGKTGITNWRGSIMPCSLVEGLKVVPTYHPSYILRVHSDRADCIQDLLRVRKESFYYEIRRPEWNFHLRPTLNQVLEFLESLPPEVTCDIETGKKQIKCIGIGKSQTEAMCIPITANKPGGSYWTATDELLVIEAIRKSLRSRNVVNQNMLYDSFYLAWLWGLKVIPIFDTMIAQGVLLPGRPKALDYLASIHCDYYSYWKHDAKDWQGYQNDDELWYYNCQDAVYTWEVAKSLRHAIEVAGQQKQLAFEMAQFEPCLTMMLRGVNSDDSIRLKMSAQLGTAVANRWEWLAKVFGHPVNPNSPTQLIKLFYTDLNIPPVISRKSKGPTTDDDALNKIGIREPVLQPVVKVISESRSLRLVKSNFIDIETPDGRMYCGYNPVGTVTFRYNSSTNPMGYGTNLQNVPKIEEDEADSYSPDYPNVRENFTPDSGYTLVEFDLSKADLRVVVWESGEEELKQMLKAGVNIYKEAGTKVTGMPYRSAKSFIHGTDYGGKPRTMAANCGITVHQAEVAQKRWFDAYPGIKRWHDRVKRSLDETRSVKNKFGFRIIFFDRLDGVLPEALAWSPQSTVAIVINTVLRRVFDTFECGKDPNVQLLMQVHDSFVCQIKTELLDFYAPLIHSWFEDVVVPYDDPLIIPGDCKVSSVNWAHMEKYVGNTLITTGLK